MGISSEEVRFGIVPGLADLADKLSGAFAHSRNREFEFKKAQLGHQNKKRREQAAAMEKAKKEAAAKEKARRGEIEGDLKRADQLRKESDKFAAPQGTIDSPTEDEIMLLPNRRYWC